jgi:ubiquinone/menaquinone biosynthesis C-methylase UbiE
MVKIGWKIKVPSDLKHIISVLSYSPDYNKKRLEKIGFTGKNTKLLDAACGCGAWAVTASYLNLQVKGIDSTPKYLAVGKEINSRFKRKNLNLEIGVLEKLPYKDKTFDYIVCYDAWMYTKRAESLKEMHRVLKAGGKIYLGSIAGFGWYLSLIAEGFKKGSRNLIITALKAIKNHVYMTEKESRNLLEKQGFKILGVGSDGSLGDKKLKIEPMFGTKKFGFWCVYEILGQKL